MASKEEEIINREIKKLGALGGPASGAFTRPADRVGGVIGSAAGALWAAKRQHVQSSHEEAVLEITPEQALTTALSVLNRLGTVVDGLLTYAPYPYVSAQVRSGWFNLKPTVIHFEILGEDGDRTHVRVTALAKEGFIDQKSSAKAVRQFWRSWPQEIPSL